MTQHYIPRFENPYPDEDYRKITSFKYKTPLVLFRAVNAIKFRGGKEDADYILAEDYTITYQLDHGEEKTITVPKGLFTDLSSVPWYGRWLVGRVGPHLEASIVHDFLFIAWQTCGRGKHRKDWRFADRLMLKGMKEAKVGVIKRSLMFLALYAFGKFAYMKEDAHPLYHDFSGSD